MKRALLMAAMSIAFAATGCGGDECSDAVDKLEECDLPSTSSGSCDSDTDECEADCINSHTCDEIQAAFAGTPNDYSDCDDACN